MPFPPAAMPALLVLFCIAVIIVIYFRNNPLRHSR
jgi:hypothetical protein